jgi:uncharacterized membrane protein
MMRRLRFGASGNKVLALLAFASWLLLGVSWVMSVYAYPRLPEKMAFWTTVWSTEAVWGERAPAFFVYPIAQTLFFLAFLVLAKVVFFRAPRPDSEDGSSQVERDERRLGLKKEVAYLGLIFLNLVFIHLQTSLILISHGLAKGINRFYFAMLLVVLLLLIPYYRVRRQMIGAGSR